MAKPAPIRLAGTIAATALCVAAATEAASQTPPQDSAVLNQQLQLGDVFAEQTLNVAAAQAQVTATTSPQATSAAGADQRGGALTGQAAASAVSSSVALYGEGSFLHGEVDQTNAATVRAFGRIESQYTPAEAAATSEAIGNAVAATSVQTSGQNLAITQTSTGDFLE